MSGLIRVTRLTVVLVLAGFVAPSASALAQGETAFPLLAYQPYPLASSLNAPPAAEPGTPLLQDIEYQRNPLIGAALGAIIGAAAGYVAGSDEGGKSRGESALVGAAVGAGIGLVVGYFIKTPVVKESAMGQMIPTTLAVTPSGDGSALQVGWSRTW